MENKVYYGQYSLKHWVELILQGNIILPKYQRHFVWNEDKVRTLIKTFQKNLFVPPVTIGAFKNDGKNQNLILDGQQRLTSILLAYLDLFPDEKTYKKTVEELASDNDDDNEDRLQLDNVIEWTFDNLTKKGRSKREICAKIQEGNYKKLELNIDENLLINTSLGFSYLVPSIEDENEQQKYYSSVFRNINIQGQALLPLESRKSLYFLDEKLSDFFDPEFCKDIKIKISNSDMKFDFVRYLSLLSQYHKDRSVNNIARGYKPKMEEYYEKYIYFVVEENTSEMFGDFSAMFPNRDYSCVDTLKQAINGLNTLNPFPSIIDLDLYFFGLIYTIVFEKKKVNIDYKDDIQAQLTEAIRVIKSTHSHTRAPSALKYLRERIAKSIEIYSKFVKDEQPL